MLYTSKESAVSAAKAYFKKEEPLQDALSHIEAGCFTFNPATFEAKYADALNGCRLATAALEAAKLEGSDRKEREAKKEFETAKTKVSAAFLSALAPLSYSVFVPGALQDTLDALRGLTGHILNVPLAKEHLVRAANKVFAILFEQQAGEQLTVSRADAPALFEFIKDVLMAPVKALGSEDGVFGSRLESVEVDADAFQDFYRALSAEFYTHTAKMSHSSALLKFSAEVQPGYTGYINSAEVGSAVTGSLGGGMLIKASWLLAFVSTRIQVEGLPSFSIFDLLYTPAVRAPYAEQGLSELFMTPVVEKLQAEYSPYRLPIVKWKTGEALENFKPLHIVPSNGTLAAMARLSQSSVERSRALVAEGYRTNAVEALQALGLTVTAEELAALDLPTWPLSATTLKKLQKLAEKQGVKDLTLTTLGDALRQKEFALNVPTVPVVASNNQNVSQLYADVAGKGLPRFKAYLRPAKASSQAVRNFHALPALFKQKLEDLITRANEFSSITDKYQVGSRWLPQRVQADMAAYNVTKAAERFVRAINALARRLSGLTDEDVLALGNLNQSPIQHYALHKQASDTAQLEALATQGVKLLRTSAQDDEIAFVDAVVTALQKDA